MFRRLATLVGLIAVGAAPSLAAKRPFTVVIDPGHGGNDQGAVYRRGKTKIAEKDLVLWLSKDIARELRKKKIRAILTRNDDRTLPLPARTALANRSRADIFLSIHINASGTKKRKGRANGVETYILNNSTDHSSKRLADLENSVLEGSAADAFKQTDVALIVKDLLLDHNLSHSRHLACEIQNKLVRATRKPRNPSSNRGVRQALFYVLLGADMPSALLEAGFIDHPRDRRLILRRKSRRKMAQAIAEAITAFRGSKNRNLAVAKLSKCKIR